MDGIQDLSVREISVSRLKLSDELIFAPQVHNLKTYYQIEVPSQGTFYRVGYAEYVFLSLLDGERTVAQALTITARTLGAEALTQSQGIQVATWLVENGLAESAEQDSPWSPPPGQQRGSILQRVNPFWMKFSFGSPDRMLSALLPALGWLFSPAATIAGLLVILFGTGCVLSHWTSFAASAANVLTPHNWLWMLLAWLGLKVIHELSHALACKYHRGEVRETGVILILLAPMAYVDVTSCWRFPSRWQRIHVAAAGIYAELVVAALAAIAWVYVDSPILHHLLFNVIVMASLSTLLFNANPLMRFDGYYILADLLKIPNLGSEGRRSVARWTARIFFGDASRPPQLLGFRRWFVAAYGLAAAAWRVLICISLLTAASVLLEGGGLLLAMAGVVSWFGMPIWNRGVELKRRFHEQRSAFVRAVVVGTALAAAVSAILLWAPWPGAMKAPVVVEYSNRSVVRSTAAGFVRKIHVQDGQTVKSGQLLVELENDDLHAQLLQLEYALQKARVRQRVALNKQNAAEAQIARRNQQAIEERLGEVREQTAGLHIRAPIAGRVIARGLDQSLGTYVKQGVELLGVADESSKELVVSVGQAEIDAILPLVGKSTRFRIGGRLARTGRLDRLNPRASTALPHPAMSSAVGGSLAVTELPHRDPASQTNVRLVEPRFRGVIALPPEICGDLGAGEQGYAMLGLRQERLGEFAWLRFYRWCESLLRPPRR